MRRSLASRWRRVQGWWSRATANRRFAHACHERGLWADSDGVGERSRVLLDVRDSALGHYDNGRYLYLLLRYFILAGFEVQVLQRRWTASAFMDLKFPNLLLRGASVRFRRSRSSTPPSVLMHDRSTGPEDERCLSLCIQKGLDQTLGAREYEVFFPYTLHPLFYEDESHRELASLRALGRARRVVFSGNMNPRTYDNEVMQRRFGKLSRSRVITTLRSELSPDEIRCISRPEELGVVADRDQQRFVLVQTGADFRVPKQEWLRFLATSDFFLACPGIDMPLAHNLVEAMSVGTIPLTEYPEYFDPPLRDGHECVVYSGEEGLLQRMREILSLSSEAIRQMRNCAIAYYEAYLTPAAFVAKVERQGLGYARLAMNFLPDVEE